MYRNNARHVRDILSARRLISERATKALHFRKVLENEGFEFSKKWAFGSNTFWFLGILKDISE